MAESRFAALKEKTGALLLILDSRLPPSMTGSFALVTGSEMRMYKIVHPNLHDNIVYHVTNLDIETSEDRMSRL